MKPSRVIYWVLLGIVGLTFATLAIWYAWYRVSLRPVGSGQATSFSIPSGEKPVETARRLQDANLIRNKSAFMFYLTTHGLRSKVKAGSYSLSPDRSSPEIMAVITEGKVETDRLVVPEGKNVAQIRELATKFGIPASDFDSAMKNPPERDFLATRPSGVDLEGYLFPDSYTITKTTTAGQLLEAMLDDFGRKVGDDYVAAFQAEGFSLHQGLTLASIIEKEVANPSDRPIVSGIFMNRLRSGQPLQSDVTVHYAADQLGASFSTTLESPYNTYKVKGLPIGPICNPGLSALNAAAHPAKTDFVYFLAGRDGKTYFAKTFAEHQANIAKHGLAG